MGHGGSAIDQISGLQNLDVGRASLRTETLRASSLALAQASPAGSSWRSIVIPQVRQLARSPGEEAAETILLVLPPRRGSPKNEAHAQAVAPEESSSSISSSCGECRHPRVSAPAMTPDGPWPWRKRVPSPRSLTALRVPARRCFIVLGGVTRRAGGNSDDLRRNPELECVKIVGRLVRIAGGVSSGADHSECPACDSYQTSW